MDGRVNNKGTKGNKGGNPGYGKNNFIASNVSKFQQRWWDEWEKMILDGDKTDKKWALQEFNKLQSKMAPQSLDMNQSGEVIIKRVSYADSTKRDNGSV